MNAQKHAYRLRVVAGLLALSQLIGWSWAGYTTGLMDTDLLPVYTGVGFFIGVIAAVAVAYIFGAAMYLVETAEANRYAVSQIKSEMSTLAPRIRDLVVESLEDAP